METAALTMMLTMKGKRCSGTVSTSKSASDVKARDDVSGCFSKCGYSTKASRVMRTGVPWVTKPKQEEVLILKLLPLTH